jgi:hypothetical protein
MATFASAAAFAAAAFSAAAFSEAALASASAFATAAAFEIPQPSQLYSQYPTEWGASFAAVF